MIPLFQKGDIYQRYLAVTGDGISRPTPDALRQRTQYIAYITSNYFPKNRKSSILELGCGHGAFLRYLQSVGYDDSSGIDISEEQVAEAKKLGIRNVTQADIWQYLHRVPDQRYDVIIAYDVLEHFTKAELQVVGSQMLRILKPNGTLIIHVPNSEGLFGPRAMFWDITHETNFSRNSMGQLLRSLGFSYIHCYEDKIVVHGVLSAFRSVIWMLVRFVILFVMAAETGSFSRNALFTQNMLVIVRK